MQHFGYFETLLYANFPDKDLAVRNMGWSGDEVNLRPRPLNFGDMMFHLSQQMPDIILACSGMNESFAGPDGEGRFESDLTSFLENLLSQNLDGAASTTIYLISPIAHERVEHNSSDPDNHNSFLRSYVEIMRIVSERIGIVFVDLFGPTLSYMTHESQARLTFNGIHPTDFGYRTISKMLAEQLGLNITEFDETEQDGAGSRLRQLVIAKNRLFFDRWRPVNAEYIFGRRKEPFGVVNFPLEMARLDKMIAAADREIWSFLRYLPQR